MAAIKPLNFMTEAAYQNKLLDYLRPRLRPTRAWPSRGTKTCFLGRTLFPDIEIESDLSGRLSTIAIVELKINSRLGRLQVMLYALSKDVPAYCVVDGFRRTPVKWHRNPFSSQLSSINQTQLDNKLKAIARAIEDFNYENFL